MCQTRGWCWTRFLGVTEAVNTDHRMPTTVGTEWEAQGTVGMPGWGTLRQPGGSEKDSGGNETSERSADKPGWGAGGMSNCPLKVCQAVWTGDFIAQEQKVLRGFWSVLLPEARPESRALLPRAAGGEMGEATEKPRRCLWLLQTGERLVASLHCG